MHGLRLQLAVVLFIAGASVALACGPFFPWQLLDDRTTTLKSTPNNSFAFEAAHLVAAPSDRLKAVEPSPWMSDAEHAKALHDVEIQGLSADQADLVAKMRGVADGDEAYALGAGLPAALRLYTAGAVDFHKADLAPASHRFAAILSLPKSQQSSRATWAAYMLGRTAALSGDLGKAAAMFALTRRLAVEGQPDPLGLAVDSFGEEAKFHLDRANELLMQDTSVAGGGVPAGASNPDFVDYRLPAKNANAYRSEIAAAVSLYAEQAARGSDSGVQSLRIVAQNLLSSFDRIDAVVASNLVQRLLVNYALARLDDNSAHDQGTNDAGTRESGVTLNPILPPLVGAIVKFGGANPFGADRLAALSYRTGRYDLAAKLADRSASPLAEWVKAKIALQKGDLAAAAAHYAAATRGFPQTGDSATLDSRNSNLVVGESGTLALARGDYVDALDKLYPAAATYWGDVAYIAERVLTVDELKRFVDARVPPSTRKPAASQWYDAASADPPAQLRNLLARRLMREGRYAAALSYFGDPKLRATAASYALAIHKANTDWGAISRAQAFFAAAVLARESGIDFLGYEAAPDYAYFGGSYSTGIGQDVPMGAYVTAGEMARARARTAKPNLRFHYRYIAVDEASRAADLLPQRSQAFAAVLCRADGWMMQTPGEAARVKAIYKRYLTQGAHVAFAKHFGYRCPAPDFARIRTQEWRKLYLTTRHYASAHRWWLAASGLLILLCITAFVAIRRRS